MEAKKYCPKCKELISKPSPYTWKADYAYFVAGKCPKCRTPLIPPPYEDTLAVSESQEQRTRMTSHLKCKKCGSILMWGTTECPRCGSKGIVTVDATALVTHEERKRQEASRIHLALLGVTGFVAILLVVLWRQVVVEGRLPFWLLTLQPYLLSLAPYFFLAGGILAAGIRTERAVVRVLLTPLLFSVCIFGLALLMAIIGIRFGLLFPKMHNHRVGDGLCDYSGKPAIIELDKVLIGHRLYPSVGMMELVYEYNVYRIGTGSGMTVSEYSLEYAFLAKFVDLTYHRGWSLVGPSVFMLSFSLLLLFFSFKEQLEIILSMVQGEAA